MRAVTLYLAAAACLILIVSMAWWTREFIPTPDPDTVKTTMSYTVQTGDSVESIAEDFHVDAEVLAEANIGRLSPGSEVEPGQTVVIPEPDSGLIDIWGVHGLGLLAELIGVLLSFWLSAMIGILPKRVRGQIFGIAAVLAIVSYAASQSISSANPLLTPQFIFGALKDGFMWSAAFPMLARLIGIKDLDAVQLEE